MTEPNPLEKAELAVRSAETDTAAVQLALAAMELAKAAQQQPAAPACQHQHKPGRSAGEWLALACAVCVGGIGIALASIAIAIGATCATVCLLILRRLWQDMQKGR